MDTEVKPEVKQEITNQGDSNVPQDQGTKRSLNDQSDDVPEKRSRQTSDAKCELRCLVSSSCAGGVIGKGGENIKDMRKNFDASIQIPDADAPERVLNIRATPENCGGIIKRILPLLNGIRDRGRDGNNQDNKHMSLSVLVHKSQAGGILGIKGFQIKELREQTGATIKMDRECAGGSTDRICNLSGDAEKISKCLVLVVELLQKFSPKGRIDNYDPVMDCQRMSMQAGGFGGPSMGRRGGPAMGGRGGFRGGMGRGRGNGRMTGGRSDRGNQFVGNRRQGNGDRYGGNRNFGNQDFDNEHDFNDRGFNGNRSFGMDDFDDFRGNRDLRNDDFGFDNDFGGNRDFGRPQGRNNRGNGFQGKSNFRGGRGNGRQAQGSRSRPRGSYQNNNNRQQSQNFRQQNKSQRGFNRGNQGYDNRNNSFKQEGYDY